MSKTQEHSRNLIRMTAPYLLRNPFILWTHEILMRHKGSRKTRGRADRYSFLVKNSHLLVGSRTGAMLRRFGLSVAPRFLWECLNSQTVSPFPVPASSNPSCRFPAMGLPACFLSRIM